MNLTATTGFGLSSGVAFLILFRVSARVLRDGRETLLTMHMPLGQLSWIRFGRATRWVAVQAENELSCQSILT